MTQEEMPQEELPPAQDESMTDEALLSLSTGMPEVPPSISNTDENLLGGGGSAITPKKRGRPAGSKNKPKTSSMPKV